MDKTLPQNLNTVTEKNENTVVTSADENKGLSELMVEMKAHLDHAAKELLQPRQEVVDKLVGKILH